MNVQFAPHTECQQHGKIFIDSTHELDPLTAQDVLAYDERANTFDIGKALDIKRANFTKPLRNFGQDAVLLELACGRAAHSLKLLQDGYQVIVSDVSPKTVSWVADTAHALEIDTRGTFVALDASHLPFSDSSIDGIFMTASLHHMPSPLETLKECRRVLRPGGVLLVGYEPAKWSYVLFKPVWNFLKKCLRKDSDREVSLADDETDGFSMGELHALAREAGFSKTQVNAVDFLEKIYEHAVVLFEKLRGKPDTEYRPESKLLRLLDSVLGKIPLLKRAAWNYDLIATKNAQAEKVA